MRLDLLNCINGNQVPRGTTNHPDEASQKFASLQTDLGFQLESGDRVKRSLSDIQPCGLFSRAPRGVENIGNVIEQALPVSGKIVERYLRQVTVGQRLTIGMLFLSASNKQALGTQTRSPLRNRRDL